MDGQPKNKLTPRERARNSKMRARLRGSKRIDLMLGQEAAIALMFLCRQGGKSTKAIKD